MRFLPRLRIRVFGSIRRQGPLLAQVSKLFFLLIFFAARWGKTAKVECSIDMGRMKKVFELRPISMVKILNRYPTPTKTKLNTLRALTQAFRFDKYQCPEGEIT